MKEVVSLHIGQFGVQTGSALWDLYCLEHDVMPDGSLKNVNDNSPGFETIFEENSSGRYSPRAIFTDLEPTVIDDQIRKGYFKNLYEPEKLITGKEDAANNYARGRYTIGRENINKTIEAIRLQVEKCDHVASFMSFHSLGGGTGSGFNFLIDEELHDSYCKKALIEVALFPSRKMSTSIVESYNAVLTTNAVMDKTNCVIIADNEALYRMCQNGLKRDNATYSVVNRFLAQAVSTTTSTFRFESHQQTDVTDFHTNLVPYPRLHFPVFSLSPVNSLDTQKVEQNDIVELTIKCSEQNYRLAECNNEKGLYMACCITFRGSIPSIELHEAIKKLKQKIKFVDWCPTGFKIGATFHLPKSMSSKCQISMLSNNTAMKDVWENLHKQYDLMSKKGAFWHWFLGEGMEQQEFEEAGSNIQNLISDYKECNSSDNSSVQTYF